MTPSPISHPGLGNILDMIEADAPHAVYPEQIPHHARVIWVLRSPVYPAAVGEVEIVSHLVYDDGRVLVVLQFGHDHPVVDV